MSVSRRAFLRSAGAILAAGAASDGSVRGASVGDAMPILDTHQHLWDPARREPPWLAGAPDILRRRYTNPEYVEATRGLDIRAIYMEVDVAPSDHVAEADEAIALSRSGEHPTIAAIVGGRPASDGFADYLARLRDRKEVRGVRQVLHGGGTPAGYCLADPFVRGIRRLGEAGLTFDLCLRPAELDDGCELVSRCPGTRFVLDHCGNADVAAFLKTLPSDRKPSHDADAWRRSIDRLASRNNIICKISGIVARAQAGWGPDDLAPIVNHCLDAFGPDRVVFGGDWPVCLLGATLRAWIEALGAVVAERPLEFRRNLWHANASRFFRLDAPPSK
ncbi:MAG: amidohydrolase [Planctomycetes bacterium]|nr:amidohydrolase [Planctomycetota bacterium]